MLKLHQPQRFTQLPDAILFDIDNTLYPYQPAHERAMQALRQKAASQLSISADSFDAAFAQARAEVKQRLGHSAASHHRLLYLQRMLELVGLGSQVLLALDFEQSYWRTFLSHAELFPQVRELLDDVRILGIPIALVTDLTAQIQFRKCIYFGLERHFECIVTSEEAGHDKPHAAPFEMALAKLRPKGGTVWMIGDSAERDIRGARAAIGAICLQKLHEGVTRGSGDSAPDASFVDFADLRHWLNRQAGRELQRGAA